MTILNYEGHKCSFQEWKKICKIFPRASEYSLMDDPKVEKEDDRTSIIDFVEEGNVSGYINSSHCMTVRLNVRYALDPGFPPWHKGSSSHINQKDMAMNALRRSLSHKQDITA